MRERAATSYLTLFPEERADLGLPALDASRPNLPYVYDRLSGSVMCNPVILSPDLTGILVPDQPIEIPDLPPEKCEHDREGWFGYMQEAILDLSGVSVDRVQPVLVQDETVPFDVSTATVRNQTSRREGVSRKYLLHHIFVASQDNAQQQSPDGVPVTEVQFDDPRLKNLGQVIAKFERFPWIRQRSAGASASNLSIKDI